MAFVKFENFTREGINFTVLLLAFFTQLLSDVKLTGRAYINGLLNRGKTCSEANLL